MTDFGGCAARQVFKAHGSRVQVHDEFVHVKRSLLSRLGGNSDATIWLNNVRDVVAMEPTRTVNGYVYLRTASDPDLLRMLAPSRYHRIDSNPHTVMFTYILRDEQHELLAWLREMRSGTREVWM